MAENIAGGADVIYFEAPRNILAGQQIVFSGPVLQSYERNEEGIDWIGFDLKGDDNDPTPEVTDLANQNARVDYVYLTEVTSDAEGKDVQTTQKIRVILQDESGDDIVAAILDIDAITWRLADDPLEELGARINNGTAEPFEDPETDMEISQ